MAGMTDPIWIQEAQSYLGLREISGSEHEPGVVEFFADSGNAWVKDDETAWCGAFVGAVFARIGRPDIRPPGEKANALRARAWLNVGTPVGTPRLGDLVIFWRGSKGGASGHVGFYMGEEGNNILVLGGNQSNRVQISKYSNSRLLGYRRPPGAPKRPDDPGVPRTPKQRSTGSGGAAIPALAAIAGVGTIIAGLMGKLPKWALFTGAGLIVLAVVLFGTIGG